MLRRKLSSDWLNTHVTEQRLNDLKGSGSNVLILIRLNFEMINIRAPTLHNIMTIACDKILVLVSKSVLVILAIV